MDQMATAPDGGAGGELLTLPAGWCLQPLGSLGTWTGGGTPSKSNPAFWTDGSIPWVSPKDMKRSVIDRTEDAITEAAVNGSSTKYVPAQSLLMVMRSGILRHSFPVAVNDRVVTLNQDLRALTPSAGVDPFYLMHYLSSARHRVLTDCAKDGTTVNSIEASLLERLRVPLAPLSEQRRIVARINALFSEIAEGEAALDEVHIGLDLFRRALLKAAVTGELTKDWRKVKKPTEDGQTLLAAIKSDRNMKMGSKLKAQGKALVSAELFPLPIVPDGWTAARASELFDWSSGDFLPTAKMEAGKIPVYGGNGIAGYHSAFNVLEPTIVIGRVGFYCGAIHLTSGPSWITDNAIYARSWPQRCDIRFLSLALEHSNLRARGQGGAQPFINQRILNETGIPVPPTGEQREIVRRYSEALAAADDTRKMLDTEAADVARLKQSILKAAFEGKLVPQDPADEPASVTLARVSQETRPKSRRGKSLLTTQGKGK